jgi:hydroxymethylglutaryl-CoA reductase (NADPH)
MANDPRGVHRYVNPLLAADGPDALARRLAPRSDPRTDALPPAVRLSAEPSREEIERRWQLLPEAGQTGRDVLLDPQTIGQRDRFRGNIENFIGTVKVPVGLAGPLRVNGLFAHGDYYLPLATTEAALVASYSRGAQVISEAGGCAALLLDEGVGRSPAFVFRTLDESGRFVAWALAQLDTFRAVAERTTRHGKLLDMRVSIEGNHVYLHFDLLPGDAAGQNMVTIAAEAICAHIAEHSPVRPQATYVEANLSGDKKPCAQSFVTVRGKRVTAEVIVPTELVRERLHTTPERIADYYRVATVGALLSATMGMEGHFANGLAALYIACGQDAACVAESSTGVTRFDVTSDGGLYGAVTLPNLIVGTVGGGTKLPSQRACLEIMGLTGPGSARALAEVCAGLCLAGELSLAAAISAGQFTSAHERLARGTTIGDGAGAVPAPAATTDAGDASAPNGVHAEHVKHETQRESERETEGVSR